MTASKCDFCGRPANEVGDLVEGRTGLSICSGCVTASQAALASEQVSKGEQEPSKALQPTYGRLPRPSEILAELDRHVIGQQEAKTAVAVAVYNHYKRRQAVTSRVNLGVEIQKSNILMLGPSGCHRRSQLILMYDGSQKQVQDVQVGDLLMGPDSTPRRVLQLHQGTDKMVQVIPTKGSPWVVNQGHILTLVETGVKTKKKWTPTGRMVDVPLAEYHAWAKSKKARHKLLRTGVDFSVSEQPLPVDPYFLGVLLGDGCLCNRVSVTNVEPEVIAEVYHQAEVWGLRVSTESESGPRTTVYHLVNQARGNEANPLREALKQLHLFDHDSSDKFIPAIYKTASKQDRLNLLAGLMDTDGSFAGGFDYTTQSEQLAHDLAFVARSVGLAAYVNPCLKGCQTGAIGGYFRVSISGHVERIPTRVPRKQAPTRRQVKDVLRTGFTLVPVEKPEQYYGFSVDGDNRYLLGDFTITHNSGKTEIARAVSRILGVPFHKHDASKITQAGYVGDDVETMLQGLLGACDGNLNEAQWGIIFLDEFDKLARKSGRGATGFRDVTGEGAQQALLTMIEGGLHRVPAGFSKVASSDSVPFDTSNVLFICAGSFDGIHETVNRRLSAGGAQVGFGARERAKALTPSESYLKVEEEDILDFGIIPELAGRLPVVTSTLPLTEAEMKLILTTPASAITKQFQALFRLGDNITLEFEDAALDAIAAKAHKSPKGARALRGILEGILRESMLTLPDRQTPGTLLVTAKAVAGEAKPEFTEEPRLAVG